MQTLRNLNNVILSFTQLLVCLILMALSIPLYLALRALDALATFLLPEADPDAEDL